MKTALAAELAIRAGLADTLNDLIRATILLECFEWHSASEVIDGLTFIKGDMDELACALDKEAGEW